VAVANVIPGYGAWARRFMIVKAFVRRTKTFVIMEKRLRKRSRPVRREQRTAPAASGKPAG
jgi:hypothetical protein